MLRFELAVISGVLLCAAIGTPTATAQEDKITFDDHVTPIFRQRCLACHNSSERNADLDLSNYTNMMQGGASGSVIEPGDAGGSYLWALVAHEDEPAMPPESDPIPEAEREIIQKWIDGGALENQGSKFVPKRNTVEFAMPESATEPPAVIPVPARLVQQPVLKTARVNACGAMATSPWAALTAVAGQNQVLLYDTTSLELLGVLPFPEGTANVLRFSRNGSLLLAGGGHDAASGKVVVWDVVSGKRVVEVGDELDAVLAADISSDHKLIALGGPQKMVRVYSTATGEVVYGLEKHTDWIYSLEFSPDGVLLATGDRNGGLHVWEAMTGREYLTLNGHTAGVTGISWRIDSNVVASCSEDNTVRLWEMNNGGQIKNWGAHGGGAQSLEFTRDGRILTCGRDRVAKLWDQNGGQQQAFEAFGDIALSVTFCDASNRAVAGDWSGEIRVWNAADGARLGNLTANPDKLEQRLAAAEQLREQKSKAYQPLEAGFNTAQTKLTQLSNTFDSNKAIVDSATPELESTNQQLQTTQVQVNETKAQVDQLASEMQKLTAALPNLKDAAQKLATAAEGLGDDASKQLAQQAANLVSTKTADFDAKQKQLASSTDSLNKLNESMASLTQKRNGLQTKLNDATKLMNETMPMLAPAQEALATATAQRDQAKLEWDQAEALAAKLLSEIQFTQQMVELESRLKLAKENLLAGQEAEYELQTVASEAKSIHDAQATTVAQAESAWKAKQVEMNELVGQMKTQNESLTAKKTEIENLNVAMAQLGEKITSLGPVVESARKALEVSQGDEELTKIVQQLTQLIETRKAEQGALATQSQQASEQTTKLQQAIVQTSEQIKAMQVAVDAAQETKTMAAAKLAELKSVLDAKSNERQVAQAFVEKLALEVSSIEDEIAAAQGITANVAAK